MEKLKEFLQCDTQGRLYLKEEIRYKYGTEFVAIGTKGELTLIPVPKDPLKTFQMLGKKLPKKLTLAEVKKLARRRALKEALNVC